MRPIPPRFVSMFSAIFFLALAPSGAWTQGPHEVLLKAAEQCTAQYRTVALTFHEATVRHYRRNPMDESKLLQAEFTNKLVLDGKRFYLEDNRVNWVNPKVEQKWKFIYTSDGDSLRQFMPEGFENDPRPQGIILDHKTSPVSERAYLPLIFALRPLDKVFSRFSLETAKVQPDWATWKNQKSIKAELSPSTDEHLQLWFDEAGEVLLHAEWNLKHSAGEIEVEVENTPTGKRPRKWISTETKEKVVQEVREVSNLKWDLEVDPSKIDFQIRFPEKTTLYDQNSRKSFIVDSEGTPREFTAADVVDLPKGRINNSPFKKLLPVLGVATLAIALILFAYVLLKRQPRQLE